MGGGGGGAMLRPVLLGDLFPPTHLKLSLAQLDTERGSGDNHVP